MSVLVIDAVERVNSQGNSFISLLIQSDLRVIQSANGNYYASASKCSLPCTLNIENARLLIGTSLPGNIVKEECPTYEVVNSEGEILQLNHRWQYVPETQAGQHEEEVLYMQDLGQESV